jgi:hypothetical protein
MAETVAYVSAPARLCPGTVPPFVARFDAGSVPVGDPVFTDETESRLKDLQDAALQGAAVVRDPPGCRLPFGGSPHVVIAQT